MCNFSVHKVCTFIQTFKCRSRFIWKYHISEEHHGKLWHVHSGCGFAWGWLDPWKFHENTWDLIFQQDGAPAHTALTSQAWLRTSFLSFWIKEIRPPDSPDLSPIENMLAFLKEKVNKVDPLFLIYWAVNRCCDQSLVKYLSWNPSEPHQIYARPREGCY